MFGIAEDTLKWTVAREVVTCYEAHGVPLPPGVSVNFVSSYCRGVPLEMGGGEGRTYPFEEGITPVGGLIGPRNEVITSLSNCDRLACKQYLVRALRDRLRLVSTKRSWFALSFLCKVLCSAEIPGNDLCVVFCAQQKFWRKFCKFGKVQLFFYVLGKTKIWSWKIPGNVKICWWPSAPWHGQRRVYHESQVDVYMLCRLIFFGICFINIWFAVHVGGVFLVCYTKTWWIIVNFGSACSCPGLCMLCLSTERFPHSYCPIFWTSSAQECKWRAICFALSNKLVCIIPVLWEICLMTHHKVVSVSWAP